MSQAILHFLQNLMLLEAILISLIASGALCGVLLALAAWTQAKCKQAQAVATLRMVQAGVMPQKSEN